MLAKYNGLSNSDLQPAKKKSKMLNGMSKTYCQYTGTNHKRGMPPKMCFLSFLDGTISDDDEVEDIFVPYQWLHKIPVKREIEVDGGVVRMVDAKMAEEAILFERAKVSTGRKRNRKKNTLPKPSRGTKRDSIDTLDTTDTSPILSEDEF